MHKPCLSTKFSLYQLSLGCMIYVGKKDENSLSVDIVEKLFYTVPSLFKICNIHLSQLHFLSIP